MLNIDDIPLDDENVWRLIGEGRVKGLFQVESQLCRQWCKKLKPNSILELSDLIALVRPGCVSGDTRILISKYRKNSYKREKISNLFQKDKSSKICCLNEDNLNIYRDDTLDIIYSGQKECFKVNITRYSKSTKRKNNSNDYLECTDDHKLLTSKLEWKELKELKVGDRIAVIKQTSVKPLKETISNRHAKDAKRIKNVQGSKYFSQICYKHYEEKCVLCEWNEASLDVHHLDGNRYINNHYDNLAYLCPNCHRKQSQGIVTNEEIIQARKKYTLPLSSDIVWATFLGKESVGIKDTYDISMREPNHNFLAGNFVVHNCLKGIVDGKTMANRYHDRKMGKEEVEYLHPSLEKILHKTYGVIVYQEQIMIIARDICGFSGGEVNTLRKAIGKKDAELLFSLEKTFVEGAIKTGIVSEEIAQKLFSAIKASARYLFNKSHSVDYATVSYQTAYAKYYKPIKFYKNWLRWASEKIDPKQEKKELILAAKEDRIEIVPPDISMLNDDFIIQDGKIYFGFCYVKGIGESKFRKMSIQKKESWHEMLFNLLDNDSSVVDNLVKIGTFSEFKKTRTEILHELAVLRGLTDKELEYLKEHYNSDLSLAENMTAMAKTKKEGGGVSTVRRLPKFIELIQKLENPGRSLADDPLLYAKIEAELLGTALSCSELDGCADASLATHTCLDFKEKRTDSAVIAATIVDYREHTIKKTGEKMCFLTIQDDSTELGDVIIFPSDYEDCNSIIYHNSHVLLVGERSKKNPATFVVKKAVQI